MKRPVAKPLGTSDDEPKAVVRPPRAYAPDRVTNLPEMVTSFEEPEAALPDVAPATRKSLLGRIALGAVGILVSLALGLAADRLIRDLFAANEWLGWLGIGVLLVAVAAIAAIIIRESVALRSLRVLDKLRHRAADALISDKPADAKAIIATLIAIYAPRADLVAARAKLDEIDGSDMLRFAERSLMMPLDAKARTLTAASARRVGLVTTVSPRALIDIAFVIYESVKLGGAIARLYGAKPGVLGTWRLLGAIISHLAVTGGLVLTDGVVEQLVGQGLAAKLSARLGEGIVNGLMTVRVGIAAMRVTRPLPFDVQPQPTVREFLPELTNLTKGS
jgi:putative membrane protein